jgi:N-acetyl-anhydromuramyl-L-alanine amidase AmpD
LLAPACADTAVTPADLRAVGLRARARWLPIDRWTAEYQNYFQRHVHDGSLVLDPTAIVMHYTAGPSLDQAWNLFDRGAWYDDGDVGRVYGHLSSHFIIDRDGTVYCCVPTDRRCRGAYGVNHVAMSIEMVGRDERAVLDDAALVQASFTLVDYLCRRYHIPPSRVWGHYQVAEGRRVVPDYLDYGDHQTPDGYPRSAWRTDPGKDYMQMLWRHLQAKGEPSRNNRSERRRGRKS